MSQAERFRVLLNAVINRARTLHPSLAQQTLGAQKEPLLEGRASTLSHMRKLLQERGQASGISLAQRILAAYGALDEVSKLSPFLRLRARS